MATTASASSLNTAPTLLAPLTVAYEEDKGRIGINLLEGARDAEGGTLTVSGFTRTSDAVGRYSVSNGVLTLDTTQFNKLKLGESVMLTFSYMVSDGIAQVPQTLTVTVAGRNDGPMVQGAIIATTHEDAGVFTLNLLAGASDVDGDTLSVISLKQVSGQNVKFTQKNGVLSLDSNQFNALAEGQSQDLVFTYKVSDGDGCGRRRGDLQR